MSINLIVKNILKSEKPSDIHIRSGHCPHIRLNGIITQAGSNVVKKDIIDKFLKENLDKSMLDDFHTIGSVDFAAEIDKERLRVNAFNSLAGPSLVMRIIPSELPKSILLPNAIMELSSLTKGLVLVTGPTGSGKSTTQAILLDIINEAYNHNIITIEDPIEFVHKDKKSIISQRQVGNHTNNFSSALKAALREDPDVILMGELRDMETISLALTAAETGHLVMGTLHTNTAPSSVSRIIDVFPAVQQDQVRAQLADSLAAVVTQKLLTSADGNSRYAAFEIMLNNLAIANLIRDSKIHQIYNIIQTSSAQGMMLMDASINKLKSEGKIR